MSSRPVLLLQFEVASVPKLPRQSIRTSTLHLIASRHLELNDAVSQCSTEHGPVYSCTERRCQHMGMAVHAHSKRLYLIYAKSHLAGISA